MPYYYREIVWTIAPLVFGLIMIQMYFGRYKTEQLGWNTAYGNTISLMWVTAILLKFMNDVYGLSNIWHSPFAGHLILVIILAVLIALLAIVEYQHLIPPKFAFLLSSSLPMSGLAYFTIIIVMGQIPLDWVTFWACAVLFAFFAGVFNTYRRSITPSKSSLQTLKKHEKERKKKVRRIKRKVKKLLKPVLSVVKK